LYAKSRIVLGTPLTEEGDGFSAVEETMVVCERDDHDGTDNNLAVDNDGLLLDGVHAEHGSLGEVDAGVMSTRARRGAYSSHSHRCTEERAEDTAVGDGERPAGHVLEAELVVAGLGVSAEP
jgi:hypothetical protein